MRWLSVSTSCDHSPYGTSGVCSFVELSLPCMWRKKGGRWSVIGRLFLEEENGIAGLASSSE